MNLETYPVPGFPDFTGKKTINRNIKPVNDFSDKRCLAASRQTGKQNFMI